MRLLFCLCMVVFSFAGCRSNDKPLGVNEAALKDSANFTSIQWLDSTNRNFGKIAEGQKLEVSFSFKNSGNRPLIIARVQPSCGCTVAEQPTEPIAPGSQSVIKAVFNSEGHIGINRKTIYVYANTKGTQQSELQFSVAVEKKKW
jgi:hypothetical protein